MHGPDRPERRAWLRDPFLFGLALLSLGFVTVTLAITGRLFDDPVLLVLAALSVIPAFWLFYRRGRVAASQRPNNRYRRR